MKKVGIVTVNFNGGDDTLELLESFKKLDAQGLDVKTIVVDNGSTDSSFDKLAKIKDIDLIQTGINLGFTGGYNRGMEYALAWGADYVFIINNDTIINSKDLLLKLIETLDSNLNIGVVSPKIYFQKGFEFHKDRYKDEEMGKIIWYAGGEFDWDNVFAKHRGIDEVDLGKYSKVEEVKYVSGCTLLFKKEFLEKVGMFDTTLFSYMEDGDLMVRSERFGFKKYYDGRVSIFHKVSQTLGIGSPFQDYFLTRNRLIFGFKYATLRTKFALLREALRFLVAGREMQKKGVLDFFQGIKGPSDFVKTPNDIKYPYEVSIVSSNYNTTDLIENLVKSILNSKSGFDPKTMEIIIADDCSPENPEKVLAKYIPKISFFRNIANLGFTRSFNRLLKLARGKYILMLNSDTEVQENSITEFLKTIKKFDDNAMLGGRLYFPDGRTQDSVFNFPTVLGAIKEYFLKIKGAYFMYVPKPEVLTSVEGLVGACLFIPRKVINKVGYLDENIVSYFEDYEYSRRLSRFNIPRIFVPTAKFLHHHGASFKKLGSQTLEIHKKSAIYFHGNFYYSLLYITLWLCQKLTSTKPDGEIK